MNLNETMALVNKMINPLKRRALLTIGRAVLSAAADDSKKMQLLQVSLLAGETKDDVERFQNYGFTSVPLEGAEACAVFVGGDRDHGIIIAVDDRRYRLKGLAAGEVALYTDEGDKLVFKRGGKLEITTSAECKVISPKTIIDSAAVEIGSGTLEKIINGETFQTLFNSHTHVSGSPGNPTAPPTQPMGVTHLSLVVKGAK